MFPSKARPSGTKGPNTGRPSDLGAPQHTIAQTGHRFSTAPESYTGGNRVGERERNGGGGGGPTTPTSGTLQRNLGGGGGRPSGTLQRDVLAPKPKNPDPIGTWGRDPLEPRQPNPPSGTLQRDARQPTTRSTLQRDTRAPTRGDPSSEPDPSAINTIPGTVGGSLVTKSNPGYTKRQGNIPVSATPNTVARSNRPRVGGNTAAPSLTTSS
jgi:hypothetical protein